MYVRGSREEAETKFSPYIPNRIPLSFSSEVDLCTNDENIASHQKKINEMYKKSQYSFKNSFHIERKMLITPKLEPKKRAQTPKKIVTRKVEDPFRVSTPVKYPFPSKKVVSSTPCVTKNDSKKECDLSNGFVNPEFLVLTNSNSRTGTGTAYNCSRPGTANSGLRSNPITVVEPGFNTTKFAQTKNSEDTCVRNIGIENIYRAPTCSKKKKIQMQLENEKKNENLAINQLESYTNTLLGDLASGKIIVQKKDFLRVSQKLRKRCEIINVYHKPTTDVTSIKSDVTSIKSDVNVKAFDDPVIFQNAEINDITVEKSIEISESTDRINSNVYNMEHLIINENNVKQDENSINMMIQSNIRNDDFIKFNLSSLPISASEVHQNDPKIKEEFQLLLEEWKCFNNCFAQPLYHVRDVNLNQIKFSIADYKFVIPEAGLHATILEGESIISNEKIFGKLFLLTSGLADQIDNIVKRMIQPKSPFLNRILDILLISDDKKNQYIFIITKKLQGNIRELKSSETLSLKNENEIIYFMLQVLQGALTLKECGCYFELKESNLLCELSNEDLSKYYLADWDQNLLWENPSESIQITAEDFIRFFCSFFDLSEFPTIQTLFCSVKDKSLEEFYECLTNFPEFHTLYQILKGNLKNEKFIQPELSKDQIRALDQIGFILNGIHKFIENHEIKSINSHIDQIVSKMDKIFHYNHIEKGKIYIEVGQQMAKENYFAESIQYLLKALPIYQENYGHFHTEIEKMYTQIGTSYYNLEKHAQAEEFYIKSFGCNRRICGMNHLKTYASLLNLTMLYQKMNEHKKANFYFNDCLKISEFCYGENDLETAKILMFLGNNCSTLGDNESAINHYSRSLKIKEKNYGLAVGEILQSLLALGETYNKMGEYELSKNYYLRAIALLKRNEEKLKSIEMASIYTYLSDVLCKANEFERAQKFIKKARQIYETILGVGAPELIKVSSLEENIINFLKKKQYNQ